MSDFRLAPRSALNLPGPVDERWDGFSLTEIEDLSLWWIGLGPAGEAAFDKACSRHLGCHLPRPGQFAQCTRPSPGALLAWAGQRQWALIGRPLVPPPLAAAAHFTDQSDGWVAMELAGGRLREVLARVCPLDLDESAFPAGSAARAPFESMHGLILCRDAANGRFALFFQRSSARSFVEHIRHAAYACCGERAGG